MLAKLSLICLILGTGDAQFFGSRSPLPSLTKTANKLTNAATNLPKTGINSLLSFNPLKLAEEALDNSWSTFQGSFDKTYKTAEEAILRKENFIENIGKIENFNKIYSSGKYSFVQQINKFADMLHHEFNSILNGFGRFHAPRVPIQKSSSFIPSANVHIPDNIDWNEKGAVTPVKSQGLCGGCYAFSAAGAIEGHTYRKTGVLTELSPQNLIDCTDPYGNEGCVGGLMDPAFQYVKDNTGINSLVNYPYEAKNDTCRYKVQNPDAETTGFVTIPEGDENALKIAVATLGPVSAAIDASQDTFQFYSSGVYFDEKCKNETMYMNHAILVVGYGVEQDGKEYWLVKNSYGPEWGIGGFFKLARNANNHCGIANIASFPLV
ncbi:PREDICTED: cathepsin L1-like [Nicrophorus vespilloides]|uniref:Cathepsin L1-like n=1 Tax=Nicrophorus vespilloides TaxID=110193 RepID=A0ABM1MS30_NICVS|nr:PREDICTED: cathepsin L1-like [Nicrophorus vespilloides]